MNRWKKEQTYTLRSMLPHSGMLGPEDMLGCPADPLGECRPSMDNPQVCASCDGPMPYARPSMDFVEYTCPDCSPTDSSVKCERHQRFARPLSAAEKLPEDSDTVPREPGCLCTWEQGDSECPVHPTCVSCGVVCDGNVCKDCAEALG